MLVTSDTLSRQSQTIEKSPTEMLLNIYSLVTQIASATMRKAPLSVCADYFKWRANKDFVLRKEGNPEEGIPAEKKKICQRNDTVFDIISSKIKRAIDEGQMPSDLTQTLIFLFNDTLRNNGKEAKDYFFTNGIPFWHQFIHENDRRYFEQTWEIRSSESNPTIIHRSSQTASTKKVSSLEFKDPHFLCELIKRLANSEDILFGYRKTFKVWRHQFFEFRALEQLKDGDHVVCEKGDHLLQIAVRLFMTADHESIQKYIGVIFFLFTISISDQTADLGGLDFHNDYNDKGENFLSTLLNLVPKCTGREMDQDEFDQTLLSKDICQLAHDLTETDSLHLLLKRNKMANLLEMRASTSLRNANRSCVRGDALGHILIGNLMYLNDDTPLINQLALIILLFYEAINNFNQKGKGFFGASNKKKQKIFDILYSFLMEMYNPANDRESVTKQMWYMLNILDGDLYALLFLNKKPPINFQNRADVDFEFTPIAGTKICYKKGYTFFQLLAKEISTKYESDCYFFKDIGLLISFIESACASYNEWGRDCLNEGNEGEKFFQIAKPNEALPIVNWIFQYRMDHDPQFADKPTKDIENLHSALHRMATNLETAQRITDQDVCDFIVKKNPDILRFAKSQLFDDPVILWLLKWHAEDDLHGENGEVLCKKGENILIVALRSLLNNKHKKSILSLVGTVIFLMKLDILKNNGLLIHEKNSEGLACWEILDHPCNQRLMKKWVQNEQDLKEFILQSTISPQHQSL